MKLFYFLLPLSLLCSKLCALPVCEEVASGHVSFQQIDSNTLVITSSDKAIINYKQFDINSFEHVQFIQPSAESTVLNRVTGQNSSQILGRLSANGRVFLVNSSGIYFGPHAVVNTGSFIASTLHIRDEDFLNDTWQFNLEPQDSLSSIINEGFINASPEGFIVLMAPVIENKGAITAKAGRVLLASAEKVTLDFAGDGLIQFALDGELKKAVIDNYGQIQSTTGCIDLSMRAAKQAIKMVVNTDGISQATGIEESGGVIRLVDLSDLQANCVKVEGPQVVASGKIEALSVDSLGGSIAILGDDIQIQGAKINACGASGAGTVLIGGDYQGQGPLRTAIQTIVDSETEINVNALDRGNGGKVIVWADETTFFDGKIEAKGGPNGGDGGFVETSGLLNLGIQKGFVDTTAPNGQFGTWLLDPATITVATGGGSTLATAANCGTNGGITIAPTTIAAASSNVILCAQRNATSSITVTNAVTMTNPAISLTLTAGSTNVGAINLNNNLTTRGGAITLNGVVTLGANIALDTTNAGATATGANITFSNTINGARTLTLNSGTGGTVSFSGAVGATTALTSLTASGASIIQSSTAKTTGNIAYTGSTAINLTGNMTTSGGTIGLTGPVILNGNVSLDSTNAGGATTGGNITTSGNVSQAVTNSLTVNAGTGGTVSIDGNLTANAFTLTRSAGTTITGTTTVPTVILTNSSGNVIFNGAATIATALTTAAQGYGLIFNNGGTITPTTTFLNTGGVTLKSGGSANLTFVNGFTSTASSNTLLGTIKSTTSAASITLGTTTFSAGTSLLQSQGGVISLGATTLSGTTSIDTTNSGSAVAGANISLSSTANGASPFTLNAGNGGTITFGGAVGATNAPSSITAVADIITQSSTAKASGNISYTGTTAINLAGNVTTSGGIISLTGPVVLSSGISLDSTNSGGTAAGANISLSSTINGANAFIINAGSSGTISLAGAVGSTLAPTSITATGATITQSSTAKASGNISYTGTTAINLAGNVTTSGGMIGLTGPVVLSSGISLDSTNSGGTAAGANISLSSTLNGANGFTINAGTTGAVSLAGAIGATFAPTSITTTGATINQSATAKATGNISYTGPTAINLAGNVTTSGGTIGLTGPVILNNGVSIDSTNAGTTATGANISLSSTVNGANALTMNAGTSGAVAINGAIGATIAPTSITAIGATITQSSTAKATGNISYTGTSAVNLNGNTTTSGGIIGLTGPVILNGTVNLDTTNSGGTAAGANITTSGNISQGSASSLTVNTGTNGTVSIGGNLAVDTFTLTRSAGTTITGTTIVPTVALTNSSGNITFNGAATITTSLTTAVQGYGVIFNNGGTINPSTTFLNTGGVTFKSGGSANLTFANGLTSTSSSNTLLGTIQSTTNAAPIALGTTTFSSGSTTLRSQAGIISLGATTLSGTATIDTTNSGGVAAGANISFASTLNGNNPLTLRAGTSGNISFVGAIGGSTPLNTLTVVSANNVTASALTMTSFTQQAGAGTSTFNGSITLSGSSGFSLTGNNTTFNSSLTTSNGGTATISSSGTLTLSPASVFSLDGAFTDSGSGNVILAGSITTTNDSISFNGPITLNGATVLNTGSGIGNITFAGALNGTQNLTLTAGTGNITFTGAVGSTTRLGALLINSTANLSSADITAQSIRVLSSTGTATFNGNLNTNGSVGIQLNGNTINRLGSLTTTGTGSYTVTNSGTLTATGGSALIDGSYIQNGVGAVSLSGTITTNNGGISFASPVTLNGATTLNSSLANGAITFSNTVDGTSSGSQTLTLAAGSGAILLSGNVGATTRLGATNINSSGNTTIQGSFSANSLTQLTGTGTTTFNGTLSTTAIGGVSLTGSAFTFNNTFTTTGLGPLSINNSGLLTIGSNAALNLSGALTQSGTGSNILSGSITSTGLISFVTPITTNGTPSLNTGVAGTNISLLSTVDGSGSLTLNSGTTGNISFSGNIGGTSRIGALTITNANNVTMQNVTAASLTQTAGQGTSTFQTVNTNTSTGVVLSGNIITVNGSVTTTNSGPFHITNSGTFTMNSGGVATISGPYLQDGLAGVTLQGSITTSNQNISLNGPITMSGHTTLNSGPGTGNIAIGSTINGPYNLTLTAGTGDITSSGAFGGTSRLGNFIVTSGVNQAFGAITAGSINITESGGTLTFNGNINTNTPTGITLLTTNLVRNGGYTATNGGPLNHTFSGTITANSVLPIQVGSLHTINTGVGTINLASTIITDTGGIIFETPINLLGNSTMNTSASNGDVHLYNVVNGTRNLNIIAGNGNVFFDSALGGTTPLAALTITSAGNVTTNAIAAASITQTAGTGTTTFNGALTTTGLSGIAVTTASIVRGAAITTTGGGPLNFAIASGSTLTSTASGAISLDGPFTQTGSGTNIFSGNLTTTNDNITFNAPITLAGNTSLNSGSGIGNININSIDGPYNLTLAAGTGNITASGAIGSATRLGTFTVNSGTDITFQSIRAASINVTESGGTLTFAGNLNTNAPAGIVLNSTNLVRGGGFTATNGGPLSNTFSGTDTVTTLLPVQVGSLHTVNTGLGVLNFRGTIITDTGGIVFETPLNFTGDATFNTSAANGDIHLYNTVNGTQNFTIIAGTGDITFDAALGGTTPLNNITITSASDVITNAITAASFTQSAGTGITTFNGPISTTAGAGIALMGSAFEFEDSITTTNNGSLVITNSGPLTLDNNTYTISGPITQAGSGTITIGGSLSSEGTINLGSPITLSGNTILDTSANGSNITLGSTVDGGYDLSFDLNTTGSLLVSGNMGATTRLSDVSIINVNNASLQNITASSLTQTAGAGVTTIGAINTNAIAGISLSGTSLTLNGNFISTNSGPFTIVNSSALTLTGGASSSISGAFNQSGGGAIVLSGTLTTTNANLDFTNAVNVNGATSLSTGSGAGDISFGDAINGANNFTLSAGTGNISFGGVIGGATPLNTFTVQNCNNITYLATNANSLTQNASSGTTTISDAIGTTGSTGITIVGTTIIQNGSLTSSGIGPIAIVNSGNFNQNASIISNSTFTQSGGGTVNLKGTIASNANLSIADAITLTGTTTLSTGSSSGNITLASTVNGAQDLTLSPGTGSVILSGAVGGSTRIGLLTLTSGTSNLTGAITAASISQSNGSTTFGNLNTNASDGIHLIGSSFTLGGSVTTTMSGPVIIQNTGALTLSGSSFSIAGALTQTGSGTVTLSSTITAGDALSFASPIITNGTPSLNTGVAGTNISLLSTVDGSGSLTLNSGTTGNISFSGNIGGTSRIGALTITNANNVTMQNVTAASLTQTAGQGTSTFQTVNTNTSTGVVLSGNIITVNGSVTTTNSGPFHITNSGTFTMNSGGVATISGPYLQDGLAGVTLQGSITTSNQNISLNGPITMSGPITLNSGPGVGNIAINNTINGPYNLTLTAGTGDITSSGAFGGTSRLGNFIVTSGVNQAFGAITAGSINITESGGTLTFNGNINTNTPTGITLLTTNLVRNGGYTATNGGPLNHTFSGTITANSVLPIQVGSLHTINTGVGTINLASAIITDTGGIIFETPINLVGNSTMNTSAANGDVHLYNVVNGTRNLNIIAGNGNVSFDSALGGTTPLAALTITSAGNVTTNAISAASITQSAGTGTTTFNGALTTTGLSGISIAANSIVRGAAITTTGGGPLNFAIASGATLTSTASGAISLDGPFTQTGSGTSTFSGNLTTTNDNITFNAPIILAGNASLNSGSGIGNININSIDGPYNLTLAAGTGNITASGAIGSATRLGTFTVNSGTDITFQSIRAASINVTESGGTLTFAGNLNTNAPAGIVLNSTNLVRGGGFTATNGGPLSNTFSGTDTVTTLLPVQVGSLHTVNTGLGVLNFRGTIITDTGGIVFETPLNFTGDATFNTSAANGDIHLYNTVNGTQNFTIIAGTGDITFDAALGGTTPLNNITITSAGNVTTDAITAASFTQSTGTGKTTFNGPLTTNAIGGISLTGSAFEFKDMITTTNGGPLQVTHSGNLALTNTADLTLAGTFSESGGGNVSLAGTITVDNQNISWTDPITLTDVVTLNSESGGNITFVSTVDGPYCLNLQAGTGLVQFQGAVGATVALNCLDVTAGTIIQNSTVATVETVDYTGALQLGGNITTQNSIITITGNVIRNQNNNVTISSGSGSGDITITGTINGDVSGRNLTMTAGTGDITIGDTIGATVALHNLFFTGNEISFPNLGSVGPGSTGLTSLTAGDTITFTGTSYNNGAQTYSATNSFAFNAGAATTLTSNNLPINFTTGTIALSPATPLTINSNGGSIVLTDVTGSNLNFTVNASTGPLTYTNIGTLVDPLDEVFLTAASFIGSVSDIHASNVSLSSPTVILISSDVVSPGSAITYNSPVVVTADNITFSTTGGDAITFNQTLDADDGANARNIIFNPSGGNIVFNAPVGNIAPLSSITIQDANDLSINAQMELGSLIQTGGIGTTAIAAGITTDAMSGINLETSIITVQGAIITTTGGPVIFDNSGSLTISAASLNIDGAFQQTGSGAVNIGGTIQTTDDIISFNSAVNLNASTTLNTVASTGADITFASTIDGAQNLTLVAASGDIIINGTVGGITPLNQITITSANDVTTNAITAASLAQINATGTTTINGAIATSSSSGIILNGHEFTIGSAITTTNGGPLTITNTGTLAFNNNNYDISGPITQSGSGSISLGGSFSSNNAISLSTAIIMTADTAMNTSASATNITLASTVDGNYDLTFSLGNGGALLVNGHIGSQVRVGDVTIVDALNITAQNITATSLTQTAGSGITTIRSINTNTSTGISLTGSTITLDGTFITTNSGPFSIVNSAPLTLTGGSSSLISGAISQSGGGAVFLGGTLATINADISFANAVNLRAISSLSSGSGVGNISFSSTLNGNNSLTLTAGTGNISFGGAIGATTPLRTFTIQSCTNITYPETTVVALIQNASSGTTTISAPVLSSGAAGITLSGTSILQNESIASTGTGPIAIINSNIFTMNSSVISAGSFTQSGGGAILNGSISSNNANLSFTGAISLSGSTTLNTGSGPGNILLTSTVDGAQNLTLSPGTGSIILSGAVGGSTPIGALTLTSGAANLTGAMTAASITQSAGSSTFGALNTDAIEGISLIGAAFTLGGDVTTTSAGPLLIQNTGPLTLSGSTFSIDAAVTQSGVGPVALSSVITAGDDIVFASAITTSGTSALNTATAGADITLLGTVDGSGSLTFNAGTTGNITVNGNMGSTTRMGAVTITNANNVSIPNITAASLTQSAGQGTSTFQILNTNSSTGIVLNGATLNINGSLTTTNSGPFHLTNSNTFTMSSNATISGQYLQDGAGAVILRGTVTTNNQNITLNGPITMTGDTTFNSGTGTGNIVIGNTLDGPYNLTLTGGVGNITGSGAFGGTSRLGNFIATSGVNQAFGAITAGSINITESGGTLTFNGNINTNTPTGITLLTANLVRNGGYTATNGGPLNHTFSGTITANSVLPIQVGSLHTINTGVGTINLASTIITDTGGIIFETPINLLGNSTMNTSASNGDIHFYNVVNGTRNLNIIAGSGNVIFDSALGGTTPLSALTITSARNVTTNAISAASITQTAGSGTTTFNGALTTTSLSGISVTTASIVRGGAITTTGSGPLSVTIAAGGTFTSSALGAITLDGAFTQTGNGTNTFSGNLSTTNDSITFNSPMILAGNTALNSGSGNGNISLNTVDGPYNLTLSAGTGDITTSGAIGSATRLGSFTVNSGTGITFQSITAASINVTESGGTLTFGGDLNTNGISGITVNCANLVRGGAITATNGGPLNNIFSGTVSVTNPSPIQVGSLNTVNAGVGVLNFRGTVITDTGGITLQSPLNLVGPAILNTSAANADILFSNTIDGTQNLTLIAGTGNITFTSPIGGSTPLNVITITSVGNANFDNTSAAALVQSSGSGTSTFNGTITTAALAGISLTGTGFVFDSAVTTTSNGPLSINNSGTLILNDSTYTISGPISQTGNGPVSLAGDFTSGNAITLASPITLIGNPTFDTSANSTNITLGSTVDGAFDLNFNLGASGTLLVSGNIGNLTRLGDVTLTNANNATMQNITAASLTQIAGSGLTSIRGINTNTLNGISLTGTNLTLNGNFITTSSGPFAIINSGPLTLTGGSSSSISGAFSQSGGGAVFLAGTLLTTQSNLSFTNDLSLIGATSLSTGSIGGGNLFFGSTINGNRSFTLTAGTGNISFGGTIGGLTPLNAFTIQSFNNITYPATNALSLSQNASSGTTTISGAIQTSGTAGITITGTTITQNSSLTAGGTGPITIINSETFTMGASVISGSTFTQSGSGALILNGTIASNNGNLTFASPITLNGTTILSTGSGAGNITLANTVNGAQNLTFSPGTGSIILSSTLGGSTRLGVVTLTSGTSNTTGAITASVISQSSGSSSFGALNTNSPLGINLIGLNFTLGGNITTTAAGPLSVQNSGPLTLSGTTFSIADAFSQTGTGPVILSSQITAGGDIRFESAITTSGTPSLNTAIAGSDIHLLSTVDGNGSLTLHGGVSGDISIARDLGSITRLGALTIINGNNITIPNITAASLTQVNGQGTSSFQDINTNTITGIDLTGAVFEIVGTMTTTTGGPCTIDHSGTLLLALGENTLLDGPFTETGGGAISLAGTLHADKENITFNSPIILTNAVTLNSDGDGDITINETIDGNYDLIFNAGGGDLLITAIIGGTTAVRSITIVEAHDVTVDDMSAGFIVQTIASGTSTFNGTLTTTLPDGIALNGNIFSFLDAVNTSNGGIFSLTNSAAASLSATSSFDINGAFSQLGTGPVSLGTSITSDNMISFIAPVTLIANTALDGWSISFGNTIDGNYDLSLNAGLNSITLEGEIGYSTPLDTFAVTSAFNLTSAAIYAGIINIQGITGTALFNEILSTTNVDGITLDGTQFTLSKGALTTNAGPLTITNSSLLIINDDLNIDGPFIQNGAGGVNITGTIQTNDQVVTITGPLTLTSSLLIDTGTTGADVHFLNTVNGSHALTIDAGNGTFTSDITLSDATALSSLTITAYDIILNGISGTSVSNTGGVLLTASHAVTLHNTEYTAFSFIISAPTTQFTQGGNILITTWGGPFTFLDGILSSGTNLVIATNNGIFSFDNLIGTTSENLNVNASSGVATIGDLSQTVTLNTVIVSAGVILLDGPITVNTLILTSASSIINAEDREIITTDNDAIFNSFNGTVGESNNPLIVNSSGRIIAGATGLVNINGSSVDNTIHYPVDNTPTQITWNGVVIFVKDAVVVKTSQNEIKPAPGMDSSTFNLASDFFFQSSFIDSSYFQKNIPIYWKKSKEAA